MAHGAPGERPRIPGGIAVALVLVLSATSVGLLWRTASNADAIQHRTHRIAASARGVNTYTDALLQLDRTNAAAASILLSVLPTNEALDQVQARAKEINALLASIRDSSGSLDTSSGAINKAAASISDQLRTLGVTGDQLRSSAEGINTDAARILAELTAIAKGVSLINGDLSVTRAVLAAILADTGNIDTATTRTAHLSACIDAGLNGGPRC
jgi:septal ring factor EnvC (AmiA/AmiB activator)